MDNDRRIGQLLVDKGTQISGTPRTLVEFTGLRMAEAHLQTHELRGLADAPGELGKATAGYDLRFDVRIELGGNPLEDVMGRANGVLAEVIEPPTLW